MILSFSFSIILLDKIIYRNVVLLVSFKKIQNYIILTKIIYINIYTFNQNEIFVFLRVKINISEKSPSKIVRKNHSY